MLIDGFKEVDNRNRACHPHNRRLGVAGSATLAQATSSATTHTTLGNRIAHLRNSEMNVIN